MSAEMIFVSKLFLGLVFAAVVWTVRGERSLNSSTSSDNKTERATERTRNRREEEKEGPLKMTQPERIDFLSAHNKIRNDISGFLNYPQPTPARMMKMYWSAELEASAISWSVYMCIEWKHGQGNVVKTPEFLSRMAQYGSFIGQNIWKGWRIKGGELTKMFADETKHFTFNEATGGACDPGQGCGHYTQIVWHDSFLVGCGYAKCKKDLWTAACNYLPGGNMGGKPPYYAGQPCSRCASDNKYHFTECEGNLCVPKDRCSPIKECKVVDTVNCLCSDSSYNEIVSRLLKGGGPRGPSGPVNIGQPVVVVCLLFQMVAILLGQETLSGFVPVLS